MSRATLTSTLLILAGFVLVFWQVFVRLVDAWIVDGNYSHGFLIIPIALYFVWERRAETCRHADPALESRLARRRWRDSRSCLQGCGARSCSSAG